MVIQWKKYLFKVNEFRGEQYLDTPIKAADVHAYLQQDQMILNPSKFTIHQRSLTLCINLHETEAEMRKEMNRTTRHQINKGMREQLKLIYVHHPTEKEIEGFAAFFNPFATEKGIDQCRVDKLLALREKHMLFFTYVFNNTDQKLAAHAYIIQQKRATMFYSCSGRFADLNVSGISVSIANRYMHWQNILYFKKQGFHMYDFMGLAINPNDQGGQNLNRFKRGFGGEERYEYQSFIPQNWKGSLLILVLKFLWRDRVEMIKSS